MESSSASQAGKEVLIKAVVQAIPTFAMVIVKFPKTFCKQLNGCVSKFWWRGHKRERGIHNKSWSFLTIRRRREVWASEIFSIRT